MTKPPPPVDTDADLTSFRDMPLEVVRFAKSDLVAFAPAEAVLAAIMLWGSAWHSRPAGSLTNDDRSLMRAAGFGRGAEAAWHAVKAEAMRGWLECSDGLLYHPVLSEKVRASWQSRLKQRHNSYLAAIRMHNKRNPTEQRDGLSFEDWNEHGRPEGAKAATPREVQAEMPLDEEMLRVTGYDVTRTFGAHDLQGKGIEGKGIEGKGYSYKNGASAPSAPPVEPLKPRHIVEAWNDLCDDTGLAKVVKVTGQRETQLNKRIDEFTLDQFRTAFDKIRASRFLLGRKPGSNFKATFDFLLQPSSFVKIIEGNFDD